MEQSGSSEFTTYSGNSSTLVVPSAQPKGFVLTTELEDSQSNTIPTQSAFTESQPSKVSCPLSYLTVDWFQRSVLNSDTFNENSNIEEDMHDSKSDMYRRWYSQ